MVEVFYLRLVVVSQLVSKDLLVLKGERRKIILIEETISFLEFGYLVFRVVFLEF